MFVRELLEKLKDVPEDARIYLDDTVMPTPLGLTHVEIDICPVIEVSSGKKSLTTIVTLSTYNWKD